MRLILLLILLIPAQTIEYGELSELRGIKRVFIDTGTNTDNRERIIKELEKSKLKLTILSSPETAELVLTFNSETSEQVSSVKTRPPLVEGFPARSRVEYDTVEKGEGVAFVPLESRRRVLFSWTGQGTAKYFASRFIKAYKKVNNIK